MDAILTDLDKPDAEIERIWARKRWASDDEIDHLDYKLYDLTPDEIAIVEGHCK